MEKIRDILSSFPGASVPHIDHGLLTIRLKSIRPTIAVCDLDKPEDVDITTTIGKALSFPQVLIARETLMRTFPQVFTMGVADFPYVKVDATTIIASADVEKDWRIIDRVAETHLAIAFLVEPFFDPTDQLPNPNDLTEKLERRKRIMHGIIS